jgi:hypothetical protein
MASEAKIPQEKINLYLEGNDPIKEFFNAAKACGYIVCMNGPHRKAIWLTPDDFINEE